MQFSPKKHEKYCCALRNLYQKEIMRNGIDNKMLRKIKKITAFSLSASHPFSEPTDIYMYCRLLLACAQFHLINSGLDVYSSMAPCRPKNADRRMIAAIILECCSIAAEESGFIKIKADSQNLYIVYSGSKPSKTLKRLIHRACSSHLIVTKGNIGAVCIPCPDTEKKPKKITGGIDLLLDPLSIVKIFLSTALD